MNSIVNLDRASCTGCKACFNVCPAKAIEMVADSEGFALPKPKAEICTDCGLCLKTCPVYQNHAEALFHPEPIHVYAAAESNIPSLIQSASGGLGNALAAAIVRQGGVAYGCAWESSSDFKAVHIRVQDERELPRLAGSKYVQSDTGMTFQQVLNDLKTGRSVIYFGTPCQIAGLRSYLRNDYENLITVDLICHGVPSPKMFKAYLDYLGNKEKSPIIEFVFRKKRPSGYRTYINYKTANGKQRFLFMGHSPYYRGFGETAFHRFSCYSCKFATGKRVSDITIGDYWGFGKIYKAQWDMQKYGVSALIFNTEKGKQLKSALRDTVTFLPSRYADIQNGNPALCHAVNKIHPLREKIYQELQDGGFEKIVGHFSSSHLVLAKIITALVPLRLRTVLKKLRDQRCKNKRNSPPPVGLITRRAGYNFGSSLQAYAIQQAVWKAGFDNEIINYDEYKLRWKIRPFVLNSIFTGLKSIRPLVKHFRPDTWRWFENREIQRKKFDAFDRQNLLLSPIFYRTSADIARDVNQYKTCVCGSDQIWCPLLFDPVMYLDFCTRHPVKKVAYAPSIGLDAIPRHQEEIKKLACDFSAISIRESKGVQLMKDLLGRDDIVEMPDPAMLLTAEEWLKIAKPVPIQREYILCYFLGTNIPSHFLKELQQESGCKLLNIRMYYNMPEVPGESLDTIAPDEFISLIANAEYVCTDSFHATLFSILMHRKFFCFRRFCEGAENNQNSRIYNLMNLTGLHERICEETTQISLKAPDFTAADEAIEKARNRAMAFLKDAIKF